MNHRRAWLAAGLGAALIVLSGCANNYQTAVEPQGPRADTIATLWWIMLGVGGVAYLVTMTLLMVGIIANPKPLGRRMSRGMLLTGGVILPMGVFFALLVWTGSISNAHAAIPNKPAVKIMIIGHQWWWDVWYLNSDPARVVHTADEIHIPVGQPVLLQLGSADVIHSFWVPSLAGKTDLIPHLTNYTWIQADTAGVYRGQCAEYCGMQHAHMAIDVVAEPMPAFKAWYNAALQPAREPTTPSEKHGQEVFLSSACVNCHTIMGTQAMGQEAPNLTHIGSRLSLAASTVPNTRGYMGAWISDPQRLKPGNHMASVGIAPADIEPLVDYLESLK